MTKTKIDSFNQKADQLFRPFLEKYGYRLEEKKVNEHGGQKWSVHHIYFNNKTNLRVTLKQEPYYTDYGFSFSIVNTSTNQCNILYHVSHEQQDSEDDFLTQVCSDLFADQDSIDIISGKTWRDLKVIPFQK